MTAHFQWATHIQSMNLRTPNDIVANVSLRAMARERWGTETAVGLIAVLMHHGQHLTPAGLVTLVTRYLADPVLGPAFRGVTGGRLEWVVATIAEALQSQWRANAIEPEMVRLYMPGSVSFIVSVARARFIRSLGGRVSRAIYHTIVGSRSVASCVAELVVRCSSVADARELVRGLQCHVHTSRCVAPNDPCLRMLHATSGVTCTCPRWTPSPTATIQYTASECLATSRLTLGSLTCDMSLHAGRVPLVIGHKIVGPMTALEAALACGLGPDAHTRLRALSHAAMDRLTLTWRHDLWERRVASIVSGGMLHAHVPLDLILSHHHRGVAVVAWHGVDMVVRMETGSFVTVYGMEDIASALRLWEQSSVTVCLPDGSRVTGRLWCGRETIHLDDIHLPDQDAPPAWLVTGRRFRLGDAWVRLIQGLDLEVSSPSPAPGPYRFRMCGRPMLATVRVGEGRVVLRDVRVDTSVWSTIVAIDAGELNVAAFQRGIDDAVEEELHQETADKDVIETASLMRLVCPGVARIHVDLALDRLVRKWKVTQRQGQSYRLILDTVRPGQPFQVVVPLAAQRPVCVVCQSPATRRWVMSRSGTLEIEAVVRAACCGILLHTRCMTPLDSCPQCRRRRDDDGFTPSRERWGGNDQPAVLDLGEIDACD
jgi:hypothetical protein